MQAFDLFFFLQFGFRNTSFFLHNHGNLKKFSNLNFLIKFCHLWIQNQFWGTESFFRHPSHFFEGGASNSYLVTIWRTSVGFHLPGKVHGSPASSANFDDWRLTIDDREELSPNIKKKQIIFPNPNIFCNQKYFFLLCSFTKLRWATLLFFPQQYIFGVF